MQISVSATRSRKPGGCIEGRYACSKAEEVEKRETEGTGRFRAGDLQGLAGRLFDTQAKCEGKEPHVSSLEPILKRLRARHTCDPSSAWETRKAAWRLFSLDHTPFPCIFNYRVLFLKNVKARKAFLQASTHLVPLTGQQRGILTFQMRTLNLRNS